MKEIRPTITVTLGQILSVVALALALVALVASGVFACTPEINEARMLLNEVCEVECSEDVVPEAPGFHCDFWQSYDGGLMDGGWAICNRGYLPRTVDGEVVDVPVKAWFRLR
jgi:hypothetical protein